MIKILTPDDLRRVKANVATPQILANAFASALYEGGWRHGAEMVEHQYDPVANRAFLRVRAGDKIIRVSVSYEG